MVKEHIHGRIVKNLLACGAIINQGWGQNIIPAAVNMLANLKTGKEMVKELTLGRMGMSMWGNTSMGKELGKEPIHLLMGINM